MGLSSVDVPSFTRKRTVVAAASGCALPGSASDFLKWRGCAGLDACSSAGSVGAVVANSIVIDFGVARRASELARLSVVNLVAICVKTANRGFHVRRTFARERFAHR